MSEIKVGMEGPQFVLSNQHGDKVDLKDFLGQRVILSFHPLAFTRVCAKQMQALEEYHESLEQHDALALGISVDPVPAKHAWAKDLGIKKTDLLSDFWPHGAVAQSYGIFRSQDGYSERAVIILDEKGIVQWFKIYPMSEVPDMKEVLEEIKA